MLKLAIFDVDGTLIDSQHVIVESMRRAHEAIGFPVPAREATLGIVGLSLEHAMAALHPGEVAEAHQALAQAYREAYNAIRLAGGGEAATPFYPGAREAIARLEADGWLLAIATGKARRGLDRLLDAHALRPSFVATQSADDAPSKPHPGMIENILRATGVEAARTVMIGDTSFDIEMGRAAGAQAVGVAWGYHPVAALHAAGAAQVIEAYEALDVALDAALAAPGR